MDKSLEEREAKRGGDNELEGSRQARQAKKAYMKPARKSQRQQKR